MLKNKVSIEEQIETAKACTEGQMSASEAARRLGADQTTIRERVVQYKENGIAAFKSQSRRNVYSDELKRQAIMEYLQGGKRDAIRK